MRTYELDPADLGLAVGRADDVKGGDAAAQRRPSPGECSPASTGPYRDIVTLNAAAGLWAAGRVDDLGDGLELARASIDEGRAQAALDTLIEVSNASAGG